MKIMGELEIDKKRGVIYFHSLALGRTLLRIQGLPKPIPDPTKVAIKFDDEMLDIEYDSRVCSWEDQTPPLVKEIRTYKRLQRKGLR
jgi:hypothetical protein